MSFPTKTPLPFSYDNILEWTPEERAAAKTYLAERKFIAAPKRKTQYDPDFSILKAECYTTTELALQRREDAAYHKKYLQDLKDAKNNHNKK